MITRTTGTAEHRAPRSQPIGPAPVPSKPPYARGNPLTHSVTFTDRNGTSWLIYVEPAPPEPALWPNSTVLPGRRLRFDSVDASVAAAPFPAGAPFLQERTLQDLLDRAQPVPTGQRSVVAQGDPPTEPVREQLVSVVNARSGWIFQLSRLVEPAVLLLVVIRDAILPRGRG